MSITWFDGLLLQCQDAGVYFLPESDLDELAEAAAVNRFAYLPVDLRGCDDKAALLERLATTLPLPTHFGHNWDALADALGELRGGDSLPRTGSGVPGVVLLLAHSGALRRAATADFKRAMEVLQGASREWALRSVPFWTFVALPDAEFEAL